MKSHLVVYSSLLVLAACGASGGDDGGTNANAAGNAGLSGSANAGSSGSGGNGAGVAGQNTGGQNPAGGSGGGIAGNGGNSNPQGGQGPTGGTGGNSPGGTGGADVGGAGGTGGGAGGQINIPSTCGMPTMNATVGNTCYNAEPPTLVPTLISGTDELNAAVMLASPPGDASRLFVATRDGKVHIIKDGALLPTPFVDIATVVPMSNGEDEFGLLGLAFDPGFATNGVLWLSYCADTDVANSYCKSTAAWVTASAANPDVAESNTPTPVIQIDQPNNNNHKGGSINFGADGCLYMSFGDGGSQGDPQGYGQNTDEPMASILRVDPATGMAAPGNPGFGDPRIWVYGLRNPWRTSFDRATGDFYIGDVGQGMWEEVNIVPKGTGDFNFGWNDSEGPDNLTPTMRAPARSLTRDEGNSVTGGYVYRGAAIPTMVGRYLYADFKKNRYFVLTYSGETGGQPAICDDYEVTTDFGAVQGPAAFGEDSAGELYVVTLFNGIFKITSN